MKFLADSAVIALIEGVADYEIKAAECALPIPGDNASRDWLAYGVKEGFYQCVTLERDGIPSGSIFYSKNDRGMLLINACHSMRPDIDMFAAFELAFRRLAAANSCHSIEYISARAGAIRKALRAGYKICGACVRREITGEELAAARKPQHLQQNQGSLFSTKSSSQQSTATDYNTNNNQVGVSAGGVGLGSGATGNTVNISTTDEADLESSLVAAQNISGTAIAAGADVAGASLAASVDALKGANATSQAALSFGGAAIASNEDIAGTSIAAADDEVHATLAAGQGNLATAAGLATSLGGAAIASNTDLAEASIAGQLAAQDQVNSVIGSAVNAIVAGNADSDATLATVMNSFTTALGQSTQGAEDLAAGALNQSEQIAANATGTPIASEDYGVPSGAPISKNVLLALAAVALVGIVIVAAKNS